MPIIIFLCGKFRKPMTVAILADELLKQELLAKKLPEAITVVWVDSVRSLTIADADVYVDLLFEPDVERTQHLKRLLPKPVIVNSVSYTTKKNRGRFNSHKCMA